MDAALNPFSPGAGSPPPELAGRQEIVDEAVIALRRARAGLPARSQFLLGLRGAGKTVLLNRIADLAEEQSFLRLEIEAPEDRRLAALLVPQLRSQLLKLSAVEKARQLARRSLAIVRSFASVFKVSVGDIEVSVEDSAPGTADSGDLELDLPELLAAVTAAAKAAGRGVALFIDEMQYLNVTDLSALIVAVHKLNQKIQPFLVFGAGLPQLAALAGEAKSYAERLFTYPDVGPLDHDSACRAISVPLQGKQVAIEAAALELIMEQTLAYPYFLQEWGAHSWNVAIKSPITADDVRRATASAIKGLDRGFFRVRYSRLTPREKEYVRAMAELGPGPHRSGAIAKLLKTRVEKAAALRDGLIKKGMIFSPQHGDTAFTVPKFDEFMKRIEPVWAPSSAKGPTKKTQ